jgi:hypothetical protein
MWLPDQSGKAGIETCFLYAAGRTPASYFSFAYSALASFRMGMSGSASFQRGRVFGLSGGWAEFGAAIVLFPKHAEVKSIV